MNSLAYSLRYFYRGLQWFLVRRRRPIVFTTVLLGLCYLGTRKLSSLLVEHNRASRSRLRTMAFFESAQQTSDSTILSFLPNLSAKICRLVDLPSAQQLRSVEGKDAKLAAWEKVKLNSFTRVISAVYGVVMLELFLRLQVNLVGRYLYFDSVSEENSNSSPSSSESSSPSSSTTSPSQSAAFDSDTERNYLSHAEYLVHTGLPEFVGFIETKVNDVVGEWPLQKMCSYEDLLRIFLAIRSSIESPEDYGQAPHVLDFLLPSEAILQSYGERDEKLRMLLAETRQILGSSIFGQVFIPSLNITFLILYRNLRSAFLSSPTSATTTSLPMAKILPSISKQLDHIIEYPDNEVLDSLGKLSQLHDFGYSLFTSPRASTIE